MFCPPHLYIATSQHEVEQLLPVNHVNSIYCTAALKCHLNHCLMIQISSDKCELELI